MNSLFRFVFGFFFLRFGGGGGGGETKATEAQGRMLDYNLGKLKETDALRAPYMAPGLTGAMAAYDKYSDPAYSNRMLGQANTDAMSSLGTAQAAMGRNMSRYGAAFNPNRMANESANIGLQGAAMRTGATNTMRNQIDDKQTTASVNKWKLLNDMQTDSMNQGNQIASGFGQQGAAMAQNAQNANAIQSANMGALGSLAGAGAGLYMAGAFKDGGRVGYAGGGRVGLMNRGMNGMQIAPSTPAGPSAADSAASAASTGAQMYKVGKSVQAANAAAGSQAGMLAAQEAGMGLGTSVGSTLAPATVEALGSVGAAGTAAAGTGAAAGVGTAAAANAWNPLGWALGAAALFGALDSAEGGEVTEGDLGPMEQRIELFAQVFPGEKYTGSPEQNSKMVTYLRGITAQKEADGTAGGVVQGPGTKTSDSIPANLSRGEYVVNADAVEQPGVLPALEALNQKGLEQRQNLASGGMAGLASGFTNGLTTGYNLGTQYLEQKDRRAFRDANAKAVKDSQIEAEASGGLRTMRGISETGSEDATDVEREKADEFVQGLSDEDYAVAKAQLAAEEKGRLSGKPAQYVRDMVPTIGLSAAQKAPIVWKGPVGNQPIPDQRPPAGSTLSASKDVQTYPYVHPEDAQSAPAAAQSAPAAPAMPKPGSGELKIERTIEVPKKSSAQVYASKYLPALQDQLIGQGKLTEAKALGDWAQDRSRSEALDQVGGAMSKLDAGDTAGAAKLLTKFYNGHAMPDGMFAVVKPGKGGEYVIQQFDDKTGRLVNEVKGNGETLMRQGVGYLTDGPEGVVKFALAEYQAKRAAGVAAAKDDKDHAQAMELAAIKAKNESSTTLRKHQQDRAALEERIAAGDTSPSTKRELDEINKTIAQMGQNQMLALASVLADRGQDNRRADAGLGLSQAKYSDDRKQAEATWNRYDALMADVVDPKAMVLKRKSTGKMINDADEATIKAYIRNPRPSK